MKIFLYHIRILIPLLLCDVTLSTLPNHFKNRRKRDLFQSEKLTTPARAISEGYPCETHTLTTEDGYILELHRIPHGIKGTNASYHSNSPRPVVLLMHCLFCSSNDWLMNYPDSALGFIMADQGYDVWMPNSRGNTYSRKHLYMSPKKKEFWSFSWHEMGYYDLASSIDFILNKTKEEKLSFVGYSLGSPILIGLLSDKPEYNDKIKVGVLLSPVAYLTNSFGPFFILSPFVNLIEKFTNKMGLWEFANQGDVPNVMAATLCTTRNILLKSLCLSFYSFIININEDLANYEFLPFILSNMPAGGSIRTVFHQMQIRNANRFQKYSYGMRKNLDIYGSPEPPKYNISSTIIPLGLFTATKDEYTAKPDLERLIKELPNVAKVFEIRDERFTHFNFLWCKESWEILYKHVVKFMDEYK